MLLLPSSLPCVSVGWGCLVYMFPLPTIPPPLPPPPPSWVMHCVAVRVSGMLCPPSSQVLQPPPPPVCTGTWLVGWLAVGFRVAWLVVALVGWLWLIGSGTTEFGWLVGLLVGWLVCWLVGCWLFAGVCVCVLSAHMLCGVGPGIPPWVRGPIYKKKLLQDPGPNTHTAATIHKEVLRAFGET